MTGQSSPTILTIGHSTHSLPDFIRLLRVHGVTAVADVRSTPFSRIRPDFNIDALRASLKAESIAYAFLGRELGARSKDPACYVRGRVQYRRLAQTDLFRSGLQRVVQGAHLHRIALLCAERDPLACHRSLLVAREIEALGVHVEHIHSDGRLEPHDQAVDRLLTIHGLNTADMFRSRIEAIEEAYTRHEQRVAYVDERAKSDAEGSGV